jgi:hypothetical protein
VDRRTDRAFSRIDRSPATPGDARRSPETPGDALIDRSIECAASRHVGDGARWRRCEQLRWPARSCQSHEVHGRDRDARELRSVAPLLVDGKLVGSITLVRSGERVIGAADAEQLRPHVGAQLTVVTSLDGSTSVAVGHWGLGRQTGLCLVEIAQPIETGLDVRPIELGAVSGSVDTRGAPAVLIGIARDGDGFARSWIPVDVDGDDGAGMSDIVTRVASPIDDEHAGLVVDGAALFAWFPPDPALGRAGEVLLLGLAQPYRGHARPRTRPVLAEIIGLDDLGRALLVAQRAEEREPELRQVAGELETD